MRRGHKWRLASLLGLILLLVSSTIACEQPSSSPVPSMEPPSTVEEGSPQKQPPASEQGIFTVEIGKSDMPSPPEYNLPDCNLAITLGSNSDKGVYVHNMLLRSDSTEKTVYVGTTLSRRGVSTFHVYLPYQTPMIEVVLQGLDGEILFDETLSAPSPATIIKPGEEPLVTTKDASEMVLMIGDFEAGWVRHSAAPIIKEGAQSAYHVYFYNGSLLPLSPPVIQNTIAVYPSIEQAQQAYLSEVPKNVSLENPKIGDESFLDISIPINKRLVFRKSNVVVWLWLQQDMFGDVKPYAKIIQKRISP
jgi:hypothetical protein